MEHDYTLSYIHRGMSAGVVLMCLLQTGKQEDEWLENRKREENE